jgi:hypothetical protein
MVLESAGGWCAQRFQSPNTTPPAFTFALTFMDCSFYSENSFEAPRSIQSPNTTPPAFTFALTFMTVSFLLRRSSSGRVLP